ncbi:MAG: GGDEF domain-containing protein, partial [Lachnospiraceae bacterium]|nr:GGDEF domain-containing protein [Lachnospiraceae bacterium]
MFDVNNLKSINDELGHDAGDDYLIRSSRLLCSFFKRSPVYRIGGDEFIAILEDEDYEKRHDLIKSFRDKTAAIWETESQPENRISIASGMSSYDSRKHSGYEDVAKEADQEMYENKKEMKKRYHLGSVR